MPIQVDGGIDAATARVTAGAGATLFVAGSSILGGGEPGAAYGRNRDRRGCAQGSRGGDPLGSALGLPVA